MTFIYQGILKNNSTNKNLESEKLNMSKIEN